MPNAASDAHEYVPPKILVLGDTGSGKTTQFLTLPGKKFVYVFDPNALLSLQGHDVEYEEFLPDVITFDVSSLSKDVRSRQQSVMKNKASEVYRAWERDSEKKLNDGYFDQFDWIGFDSFTTFSDLVMDEVLRQNGRAGQWPNQDDYAPQMNSITNVMRSFTALKKGLYFTGHLELKQDELSKKIFEQPLMTGRLRVKLPLLFSEIFAMEVQVATGKAPRYQIQTVPNRERRVIRTSIKGLEPFEDVTLDFTKPLDKQGLGRILAEKGAFKMK